MRILSLDIETANVFDLRPGEDISKYAPFDVAVAATQVADGEHRLWYSTGPDGRPSLHLDSAGARALLAYLLEMQAQGFSVCTWNGLGFDLQWIARAAGDVRTASQIARSMYDPLFQFFKLKGFVISLGAVAKGMGLPMAKAMGAAEAPREWQAGNHQRVFEYVLGDVRMTNAIVAAIVHQREIAWITQRGKRSSVALPRLRTVEECLRDPMPDQSWMDRPLSERRFAQWLSPA